MWEYNHSTELKHYGVLGMKWGVRRYQPYPKGPGAPTGKFVGKKTSGSISSMRAKRANKKVDQSFKEWKINDEKKARAIDSGKKANLKRMDYEKTPNKQTQAAYKSAQSTYKKDLSTNTTWRKGAIRQEVGKDMSRKFLSEAKKIQKQLNSNPGDKQLAKQYKKMMDNYHVERAKARKASSVGQKRSRKIASVKRSKTMAVKALTTAAALTAGTFAINMFLQKRGADSVNSQQIKRWSDAAKKAAEFSKYIY